MNAKRFIAPDMRRALKLVRDKLGDNAVILQNKTIPEGVELIATNEEVSAVFSSLQQPTRSQNSSNSHSSPSSKNNASGDAAVSALAKQAQRQQQRHDALPVQRQAPQAPQLGRQKDAEKTDVVRHASAAKASLKDKLMGRAGGAQNKKTATTNAQINQNAAESRLNTQAATAQANDLNDVDVAAGVAPDRSGQAASFGQKTDFGRLLGTLASTETVRYEPDANELQKNSAVLPADQVEKIQAAVAENYTVVIDTLKEEVDLLRRLLTTQAGEQRWEHFSCTQPLKAHLLQQLIGAGYIPNLARSWVEALDSTNDLKSAWKALLKHILADLPIAPEGIFKHNEAVALVGPTGAGKTSTVGKLAAAFVLNGKAQDLAIISTDAYRIGAQDQLRTLCQILGVPLTIVDDHVSLRRALARHAGRRKVLVDTAGLTQQDSAWQLQLKELESCHQSVASYMTVSTTHQLAVHVKALQDYASLPLAGCILTKLDECGRLGDSLSAVMQAQLPIAFVTTGMRIPEDLECADGLKLIKQSLSGSVGDCLDPLLAQSCFQSLAPAGAKQEKDVDSLLNVCGL